MIVRHEIGITGGTNTLELTHSHIDELAHSPKSPFFGPSSRVL